MLSTKTETPLGRLKNPFASHESVYAGLNGTWFQYGRCLQENLELLRRRFPLEDQNKIKNLLEELDNNLDLVAEILLDEQQEKCPMVCEKTAPKKMDLDE